MTRMRFFGEQKYVHQVSLLVSLNNSFARAPLFNNWVEAVQIHLEQEMKLIDVSKKL